MTSWGCFTENTENNTCLRYLILPKERAKPGSDHKNVTKGIPQAQRADNQTIYDQDVSHCYNQGCWSGNKVKGRCDPDTLLNFLQWTSFKQIQLVWQPEREDSGQHWGPLNGNPPSAINSTVPQHTQSSALEMLLMYSASCFFGASLTSTVVYSVACM